MATNMISNLREKIAHQGLKTTKYEIDIASPSGVSSLADAKVLCKATSFPAKSIGQIEVWTQGRKAMLQGETEYEHTWDVTFYETQDHALRSVFIEWMDKIDNAIQNKSQMEELSSDASYVYQLSNEDNSKTAGYKFTDLWPMTVGAIELSDESVNAIGEFTVTFSFNNWSKVDTGSTSTSS